MGADLYELRRARKRQPLPIPAGACSILGMLGLPVDQIGQLRFRLKRRRAGAEIMFIVSTGPNSAFSWNVTSMLKLNHTDYGAARDWVHAYAAGFGQTAVEEVKEREKLPTGDDRKLLARGHCREAWLVSDIPKLFAEAAVRCKHAGGFCPEDGYCHYGDCDMEMIATPPENTKETKREQSRRAVQR